MIYTTLNRIREHEPCTSSWRKLLVYLGKTEADDEPLAYSTILDAVGLDYTLWCLRAEPQHSAIWRMYAVRCARRVQHLMTDERSLQALDVAERHARGAATDSELTASWVAAAAAAAASAAAAVWAAAEAAAGADARAAWAAACNAAGAAARAATRAAAGAAARAAWAAAWVSAEDTVRAAAWDAAGDAVRAAVRAAAGAAAGAAIRADFERMLAAHHAMPLESCALVEWQGERQ